jgi:hypothetical protein
MNLLVKHQHQLEVKIGLTDEERIWIMRNNQLPPVRQFWTAYKRALNFIDDSEKVDKVKVHLKFIRGIRSSGYDIMDPKLIIK